MQDSEGPHSAAGRRKTERVTVCAVRTEGRQRLKEREEKRRGRSQSRSRTKSPRGRGVRKEASQTRLKFASRKVKKEHIEEFEEAKETEAKMKEKEGGICRGEEIDTEGNRRGVRGSDGNLVRMSEQERNEGERGEGTKEDKNRDEDGRAGMGSRACLDKMGNLGKSEG